MTREASESIERWVWIDRRASLIELEAADVLVGKPIHQPSRPLVSLEPPPLHGGHIERHAQMQSRQVGGR